MIYKPSKPFDTTVAASNAPAWIRAIANYVCDGTADDVQINAALTNNPGGKVYLSSGTFNIASTINITQSNTVLEGQGQSTILKLVNASNTSVITATGDTYYIYNVKISNLTINGNKANQTSTSHGIFFNKWVGLSEIENVDVYDCYTNGIYIYADTVSQFRGPGETPLSTGNGCVHTTISKCSVRRSGTDNIRVEKSDAVKIIDCPYIQGAGANGITLYYSNSFMISNTYIISSTTYGLYLDHTNNGQASKINTVTNVRGLSLASSQNNLFESCYFEGSTQSTIYLTGASTENQFIGCNIPYGLQYLVEIVGSSWNKFIGCNIQSASQATTNTQSIIYLRSASTNNLFSNCKLINRPTETSKLPKYAVLEADTCDNNKFIYCDFDATKYGTAVSSTVGASTVFVPAL